MRPGSKGRSVHWSQGVLRDFRSAKLWGRRCVRGGHTSSSPGQRSGSRRCGRGIRQGRQQGAQEGEGRGERLGQVLRRHVIGESINHLRNTNQKSKPPNTTRPQIAIFITSRHITRRKRSLYPDDNNCNSDEQEEGLEARTLRKHDWRHHFHTIPPP